MDPFSFPLLAAVLEAAYRFVEGLAALLQPIAGVSSAALAILVITALVRTLLIPVGVSQVQAEGTRRRLYPQILALQRRLRKDPVALQQKMAELYRAENTSQFAGVLPALAQAPVLSVVYTLFVRNTIDGHANALLSQQLFTARSAGHSFTFLPAAVWASSSIWRCSASWLLSPGSHGELRSASSLSIRKPRPPR